MYSAGHMLISYNIGRTFISMKNFVNNTKKKNCCFYLSGCLAFAIFQGVISKNKKNVFTSRRSKPTFSETGEGYHLCQAYCFVMYMETNIRDKTKFFKKILKHKWGRKGRKKEQRTDGTSSKIHSKMIDLNPFISNYIKYK